MLKLFFKMINDIDLKIIEAIHKVFNLALILFMISVYILYLYNTYPFSYNLLNSGLLLFKASLCIAIGGFISGFVVNALH